MLQFYGNPMTYVQISICFELLINIHVLIIIFQTIIPFIKTYKNPCWYDKPNHLSCLPYFIILGVQNVVQQIYLPPLYITLILDPHCVRMEMYVKNCISLIPSITIQKLVSICLNIWSPPTPPPRFWVESAFLIFLVFCVVIFVLFVFILCLVYQMLSVSLDCSFLIAPSVCSNKSLKIPKG